MAPLLLALLLSGSSEPPQNTPVYDDPRTFAWMAYRAIEGQNRSQLPELEAALNRLVDDRSSDAHLALGAVLDAFVQLDGTPPLDVLSRTLDSFPVEGLLLLKRFGPERSAVTLEALKRATGDRWFALANLLMKTPTPGFASAVVHRLPLVISIRVTDGQGLGPGYGGGSGCCGFYRPSAVGFPPLAFYYFTRNGNSLVPGVHPTFYERRTGNERGAPASCRSDPPSAEERLKYVAAMLRTNSLPVVPQLARLEVWNGHAALLEAVERYRWEVASGYRQLVSALAASGWVSRPEQQVLRPEIIVQVADGRSDRSDLLPEVR